MRTCQLVDFTVSMDQSEKRQKMVQIPGPCLWTEKVVDRESDGNTNLSSSP